MPESVVCGVALGVLALFLAAPARAGQPRAGMYRIEVRISLPNVADHAPPDVIETCLTRDDFNSGLAYAVRSDNPLRACERIDYQDGDDAASFGITCRGPNRGFGSARFESFSTGFHGRIQMNMGGKNMTMTETQMARRIGECGTTTMSRRLR